MRDIRPAPGPQNTPQKPKGIPQLPSSGPQLPPGSSLPPGLKKTPPTIPPLNKKAPLPGTPVFNKNVPPPKRLAGATVPVSNIHVAPPEKILRSMPSKPLSKPVTKPLPVAPLPPTHVPTKPAAVPPTKVRVGHRERKFVVGLIVLAILAALLAGFIFIPLATIALSLRTAPLLVDERLTIQAEVGSAEAVPGSAFFREVQVEGTAPVTSTEVIGTKATGTVQIINRATEVQKIKEQSRLVTKDGELFYMQGSATIPAAGAGSPSGVTVTIEAAEAGEQGNIPTQRLNFAA
ncbi:MAG: baseplate J/gp47 family protein, partial [Candidatus Andersenbacteria bacterium]